MMKKKFNKKTIINLLKNKKYKDGLVIDLACGVNKQAKAIGVDIACLSSVDLVWDLKKTPYPFPSSCAKKIYLIQALEHFSFEEQLKILKEIERILKPGGILDLRVPHAFSVGAFQDPTHQAFFTFHSIDYFLKGSLGYEWYPKKKLKFSLISRSIKVFLSYSRHLNSFYWRWLELIPTILMRGLLFLSSGLVDLLLKLLPFYYVDIIWILKKKKA